MLDVGSDGNTVAGNFVGTDAGGTTAIGNALAGIRLVGASSNTIGGTTPEARNVASGNNGGVFLSNASNGNQVAGNYVGIDATGSAAIPNRLLGIEIESSTGNTIGPGNVVSGNETIGDPNVGFGIFLDTGADGNSIIGNYVGTDPTGTFAIGNTRAGIRLEGASNNVVGGTTPETRNISSGNGRNGVSLAQLANNNQPHGARPPRISQRGARPRHAGDLPHQFHRHRRDARTVQTVRGHPFGALPLDPHGRAHGGQSGRLFAHDTRAPNAMGQETADVFDVDISF